MMMIAFFAIVGLLLALIGVLGYFVINHSDMQPLFTSILGFWNSIKIWVLIIIIFLFMWISGILKLIRTKIFHV